MIHPLDITFSKPLEREYEAWIVRGIEEYFHSLQERIHIWAVSPFEEVNWPADESLLIGKKLIGLQMKSVSYSNNKVLPKQFGRLNWSFNSPKAQFDLVLKFPEIFYCLPTFINRDVKEQALSHCLFWRPNSNSTHNKYRAAWYDNPQARTHYKNIGGSPRWGRFIETVLNCKAGLKVKSVSDARNFTNNIKSFLHENSDLNFELDEQNEDPGLNPENFCIYILALPAQG